MADDLKLDAKGRPAEKRCDCGAILGRTAQSCSGCGLTFGRSPEERAARALYARERCRQRESARAQAGSVNPLEHRPAA